MLYIYEYFIYRPRVDQRYSDYPRPFIRRGSCILGVDGTERGVAVEMSESVSLALFRVVQVGGCDGGGGWKLRGRLGLTSLETLGGVTLRSTSFLELHAGLSGVEFLCSVVEHIPRVRGVYSAYGIEIR